MQTMFTSDVDRDEMYNPLYPNGQRFPKDVEEESGISGRAGCLVLMRTH